MLHTFDGMDILEANVDSTGSAGHHDPWVNDPLADFSVVGPLLGQERHEKVDVQDGHDALKRGMITSFTNRKKNNDIVWLSR